MIRGKQSSFSSTNGVASAASPSDCTGWRDNHDMVYPCASPAPTSSRSAVRLYEARGSRYNGGPWWIAISMCSTSESRSRSNRTPPGTDPVPTSLPNSVQRQTGRFQFPQLGRRYPLGHLGGCRNTRCRGRSAMECPRATCSSPLILVGYFTFYVGWRNEHPNLLGLPCEP